MGSLILSGTFDPTPPLNNGQGVNHVLIDGQIDPAGSTSGYTLGATRIKQVTNNPSLVQNWTILGWSMRLGVGHLVWGRFGQDVPLWARFGTLWGGLIVNQALSNVGGILIDSTAAYPGKAQLPTDLSTFTVLHSPDDPTRELATYAEAANSLLAGNAQGLVQLVISRANPIGVTYMLPSPIEVGPGTALQMALVMTPSLLAGAGPNPTLKIIVAFMVAYCDFTIIYDE